MFGLELGFESPKFLWLLALVPLLIEDEAVVTISGKAHHTMATRTGRYSDRVSGNGEDGKKGKAPFIIGRELYKSFNNSGSRIEILKSVDIDIDSDRSYSSEKSYIVTNGRGIKNNRQPSGISCPL